MSYKAKVFKVMIASPADVATERTVIRNVIHDWNSVHSEKEDVVLMPTGWESHSTPSMGDRPQAIINKQVLADCDLLIAVFWTRVGSPTGKSISGTVEEIEEHVQAGKPAMIYFSSAPVVPESIDRQQYEALVKFKEELRTRGLYESYISVAEFKEKLTRQLAQTVIRYFLPKKNGRESRDRRNGTPVKPRLLPPLSDRAKQLLLEASEDNSGSVVCLRTTEGVVIQTHGRNLVEDQSPPSVAHWQGALGQLTEEGLLRDIGGHKGEVFSLTEKGYQAADLLREQHLAAATVS